MSKQIDTSSSGSVTTPEVPILPATGAAENSSAPEAIKKSRRNPADRSEPTIGVLISRISDQIRGLILGEIELAKLKISKMVSAAAVGIVLILVAAVLALYGLGFLLASASAAIAWALDSAWLGHLIVGGALMILALLLMLFGALRLKRMPKDLPDPKKGMQSTAKAVKAGLKKDA